KNTRTATPTRVPAPYRCGRRLCRCRCRRANRTGRPFAAARLHRAGCRAIRTARSWRGIVPFTHLAREGRMTVTIGRRELLAALGGAAAAWPLAARAQQRERMRRIGVLMNLAADDPEGQARLAAFLQSLQEAGWTVGHNAQIDIRWGAADAEQIRNQAIEMVARAPDVILASS